MFHPGGGRRVATAMEKRLQSKLHLVKGEKESLGKEKRTDAGWWRGKNVSSQLAGREERDSMRGGREKRGYAYVTV